MKQRRAFLMVYAVGVLVLVGSLAQSMLESTGSELEVARQRMHLALARSAAESGIEYAMAFVTRELGKQQDPFNGIPGGPWVDPGYVFEPFSGDTSAINFPWFYSRRAFTQPRRVDTFQTLNEQAEGVPIRFHQLDGSGTDVAAPPFKQSMQFQVAMYPEPTYASVRLANNAATPTMFYVRSRGECLANLGAGPIVLASAYAMQTFIVGVPDECPMPRPIRQVFDREPATLTPGPAPGMPGPNPH